MKMVADLYLIDGASEVKRQIVQDAETVGVTSGASAPELLVKEVVEQLCGFGGTLVPEAPRLFVNRGLLRQIFIDTNQVFYDSNNSPHHHFYDPEAEELTDIEEKHLKISEMPPPAWENNLGG